MSSIVQNFGIFPTKEELTQWLDSVDKYKIELSNLADAVKAWVGDRVRENVEKENGYMKEI